MTDQLSEALASGGAAAQRRHHLLQLLDEVWEHRHQIHHEPETEAQAERVKTRTGTNLWVLDFSEGTAPPGGATVCLLVGGKNLFLELV